MHPVVLTVWESAQILHFITLTSKAVLIGKDHVSNKERQIKISIYPLVILSLLRVSHGFFPLLTENCLRELKMLWKVKPSRLRTRWRESLEKMCTNCTHEIQTMQIYPYTKYAVVHSKEVMACNNRKLLEHLFAH